mmetsp:Transcript_25562/g.56360  ORF Transcript_25562/g.56360 Transcript_25562/m.56360 type:complete len:414 (-) Transcript_25562:52-1293(-)
MQGYLPVVGGLLVLVSAILAALGFRGRDQVVGIDLGTTFSVVALRSKGAGVTVLPDRLTGRLLLPSVVAYLPNGTIVGDRAVALRGEQPSNVVFNTKRFIGRSLEEVQTDADLHPFRVVGRSEADNSSQEAGFLMPGAGPSGGDLWVSPVEVGSEIVRHLKQSVAHYVGYSISRAVICVPAKFTQKETAATQRAFELAGFKVMRVLEEPTAAAVAYNLHKESGVRYTLVYDIGGGTLDTSLLYMNGKSVSVLGVAGDDHLGGSDFDIKMQQLLEAKLPEAAKAALPPQPLEGCHHNGFHILGEQAKVRLTTEASTEVLCLADDGTARIIFVTRAEFEQFCAELFRRCIEPVQKVLTDQMMTTDDVSDVVLVGGASRMPRIRELLAELFGSDKRLHTEIDPDITVAYGAANILD